MGRARATWRDAAQAARLPRIDIGQRDVDVPLSAVGGKQADALGRWYAAMPADSRPDVLLVSPYLRARQTADRIVAAGGLAPGAAGPVSDERLREKEFGILDRLTRYGIEAGQPQQAELRGVMGKFYHRPPGGESWCDVILRLRSALDTVSLHHSGRRVLVVGHQVVVLCMRYLLENMDEDGILAVDRQADVANCGVTEYARDAQANPDSMTLRRYNFTAPMERAGMPVTAEPDVQMAPR